MRPPLYNYKLLCLRMRARAARFEGPGCKLVLLGYLCVSLAAADGASRRGGQPQLALPRLVVPHQLREGFDRVRQWARFWGQG